MAHLVGLTGFVIQACPLSVSFWFRRKGCRVSQHNSEIDTHSVQTSPVRFRQHLPLLAALIPVICGLGFHVAGPRPQALQSATTRPPLAFHQYMVNLGDVQALRSHDATFSFTNHGDEAMELRRLETSCGCLTQQFEQRIIEPGQFGRFKLWVQSASQSPGSKQYTCQAFYGPANDPSVEYKADLVFRITLPEQSVVVTPKAIIFHQLNSQVTEHSLEVTDLRFKRLRVVEASSPSPLLSVRVVPSFELTTTEREEGVVARINVAVGAVPPGRHNAVVQIKTDDEEFDVLAIPVLIYGPTATTDVGADHTDQRAERTTEAPPFEDQQ
jgi:hypothetical protein